MEIPGDRRLSGPGPAKAEDAVRLYRGGKTVTEIAAALEIGRGSVYRALEAAGEPAVAGA